MAYTIAVTGKGGTGKTTLCGLLIDYLCKSGKGPVLAVVADANSNLNDVLGVKIETTLGNIREDIVRAEYAEKNPIPASMTKQDYLNIKFSDALIEEDDYDMLVMGRTQGKGCYCFVNGLLQTQINRFSSNYRYIAVDNEAGMEHISRGVLPGVDMILLVSDCSRRGVQAASRIAALTEELKMKPSAVKLILNKAPGGVLDAGIRAETEKHGLALAGVVPHDELVYRFDCDGTPMVKLPKESEARRAFETILDSLFA
jgi:CO dehydrogenase maturation factor